MYKKMSILVSMMALLGAVQSTECFKWGRSTTTGRQEKKAGRAPSGGRLSQIKEKFTPRSRAATQMVQPSQPKPAPKLPGKWEKGLVTEKRKEHARYTEAGQPVERGKQIEKIQRQKIIEADPVLKAQQQKLRELKREIKQEIGPERYKAMKEGVREKQAQRRSEITKKIVPGIEMQN